MQCSVHHNGPHLIKTFRLELETGTLCSYLRMVNIGNYSCFCFTANFMSFSNLVQQNQTSWISASAFNPSAINPSATNPSATNPSATNPSATNPPATNPSAFCRFSGWRQEGRSVITQFVICLRRKCGVCACVRACVLVCACIRVLFSAAVLRLHLYTSVGR